MTAAMVLGPTFVTAPVRAESLCAAPGDRPVVEVAFTGERWDDALAREILKHLRAGLEPAGFGVCPEGTSVKSASVATVELRLKQGERIAATIEVRDGVTAKRIARDIDLSALPEDGRALGVGVAADELLRASWIELALRDAPAPAKAPPPAVRRSVRRSLDEARPPSTSFTELGLRGAADGYGGGLLLLGGDVGFRHGFGRALGFELALGLRQAPRQGSTSGEVAARALTFDGSVRIGVAELGRLRAHLELGAHGGVVDLRGEPSPGNTGRGGSELLFTARAGVAFDLDVTDSLVLGCRAGAGLPLRAVTARDRGETTTGASGGEWYAGLGPAVRF